MTDSQYFVGVDGGGTKTEIVAVDAAGTEVARHTGPTSNPAVVGFAQCLEVLTTGIRKVANDAGAGLPFAGGWIGLAGFDRPGDRERIAPGLAGLIESPSLSNDGELILAGLPGRTGVAVIAGTGSIAIGRNACGERARAGGWGHIFGDEGSGWALGKAALRAIAAQIDGRGPETQLTELVMQEWNLQEPNEIVTRAYGFTDFKPEIAKLSSLTIRASWERDPVAIRIVEQETEQLAAQVIAVADRLRFDQDIPLAMSGGLLLHVLTYRTALLDAIRRHRSLGTVALVLHPALAAAKAAASESSESKEEAPS
ncbi:MAG: BadF/BadG/BcrA/BcrD ATPase family protein [Thermomicrobiales bacterium]